MSNLDTVKAESEYSKFLQVAQKIQSLAEILGIKVEPQNTETQPFFLNLALADQRAALERLKIYCDLFTDVTQSEVPAKFSEKKLLWMALSRLRLLPSADLMSLIGDDDLIEVFVGSRQVYRSFNYYNICSYSLDELESLPWEILFSVRDPKITAQIMSEVQEALITKKVVQSGTPLHVVQETSSAFKNKIEYQLSYIVPIKDLEENRTDCFITIISAKLLETVPEAMRLERVMEHQAEREFSVELFE
ncbi:MAG: hypothetical protein COT73_09235 [Bdellovibrio sp. CG10_big_fil_rev_8_21_14_0_10_47_8]|nr:MAG: hypothetical protein COT73_09235 [Bdellovibrio sp. CG10_big_fil_rev_8_21_14_0_10_47_8]